MTTIHNNDLTPTDNHNQSSDCHFDWQQIIDKYYPVGTTRRDILLKHSHQVADLALEIAHKHSLSLDDYCIKAGAMLHDIGIFQTDAPGIDCHGSEPYIRHGILGAELLSTEGAPLFLIEIAKRHTGAGISANDIYTHALPLPNGDYMPRTILEKLICYADKFYSKSGSMERKSLEHVRFSMQRFSPTTLERFNALHQLFS